MISSVAYLYILFNIISCDILYNFDKEIEYEELALTDLYQLSNTEKILNQLCIIYPDSFKITSSTYLLNVYLCNKDETLKEVHQKELNLEIEPPPVNKALVVPIKNSICVDQYNKRTIEIYGARHYKNRVYVEIKLIAENKKFGETIIFTFNEGNRAILDTCISDWQI